MASPSPIPPSVAALFARRTVVPVKAPAKPPPKPEEPKVALSAPPPRTLRRGSLLNILV